MCLVQYESTILHPDLPQIVQRNAPLSSYDFVYHLYIRDPFLRVTLLEEIALSFP